MNIAVLITCYNRKESTISCLRSLDIAQKNYKNVTLEIFLVDDHSTDGTQTEVRSQFPLVNIIEGSGSLYWAGGMRLAWEYSLKREYNFDAFLLLNDDVLLEPNFLNIFIESDVYCQNKYQKRGIYVLSTIDPNTSKISYGGKRLNRKLLFARKITVVPQNQPVECSMTNANILWVSKEVVSKIGIFDTHYVHSFADYDYTLTASNKGIPVLVCPGIGGSCVNDHGNNWLSSDSKLSERIKYLYSPIGLGYKQQVYYLWKNFKFQFPYYFTMLWLKTLFPIFWDKYKN